MNRQLFMVLTLACIMAFYFVPRNEAQAYVDPVTIAILTPIAIKAAQIVAPHVFKAMGACGRELLKGGVDLIGIVRLPLGVIQSTVLCPWMFTAGLKNIGKGVVAPFKFAGRVLLMPLAPLGVSL